MASSIFVWPGMFSSNGTSIVLQQSSLSFPLGTTLVEDAANTLAQRNGTNAQTARWMRTWTSAANTEYLEATWSGNNAIFRTSNVGATQRPLYIDASNIMFDVAGSDVWAINTSGNLVDQGTHTITLGSYIEGTEQVAPSAGAANSYRLFAQDNGGGKTQLMVIFNSGAAQQLAIQP